MPKDTPTAHNVLPDLKMTTPFSPSLAYLARSMVTISASAFKRSLNSHRNLPSLVMILVAPLIYFLRFRGLLPTPVGRVRIVSNESMRSFTYGLFKTQFWYLPMMRRLAWGQRRIHTAVDVGACLGDFTLAISGSCDKVIAIEPSVENFHVLCENIKANSLGNVVPIRVAAHDTDEDVSLCGNSSDLRVVPDGHGQRVTGLPLDRLLEEQRIGKIDLMKVDVQGHETLVLNGMRQALERHRVELMVIEVHLARHVSVHEVTSIMNSCGYHLVAKDDYLFQQPQLYFTCD